MADHSVSLVLATSTGGVGAHVLSLVRGLGASGWTVRVCGPAATDGLFGFSTAGAQFCSVPIAGVAGDVTAIAALRRATRGSELVHAHGLRAATVAALAGVRPLVVTWHNSVFEESSLRRALLAQAQRLVARRAAISLAASSDLARTVRELGGRDVRDGPVALALAAPVRDPAAVRAELGLLDGQRMVLAIARLHRQKGLDVLVTAAARWAGAEVMVVIAGDGPLGPSLQEQINATDAPVRLLGRRSDIADLVTAADLVVLPSRWEARSLAAQEALRAGRPLVATAVGGLPELLGTGALLIGPDDVEALDGAVRGLLEDPSARAELAGRGLAQAARWPTEADTVAQVRAVYEELLGEG